MVYIIKLLVSLIQSVCHDDEVFRWSSANTVDPDQTSSRGALWLESTRFAILSGVFLYSDTVITNN